MILTIRTDKPEAEVGVYTAKGQQLSYYTWLAHRELSNTLLVVLRDQLAEQHAGFHDITGIVVFKGPGSFTGLRIGITVANTLSYALRASIVGVAGDDWQEVGITMLLAGQNDKLILPEYGAEANITKQKK